MHRGFIKLFRCVRENDMWQEKPFDRARAWIDLILIANHKDGKIRRRGIQVDIKTGEVGHSLRELSERWGWSLGKVQRYIDDLKKDNQIDTRIDTENVSVTSVICLTNYEKYQSGDTEAGAETGTETIRRQVRKRVQNKNEKNGKNYKHTSAEFDEFWNICPARAKRCGRGVAEKSWAKHVNGNAREVIDAMIRHTTCKDWLKSGGEFIPFASTWLNQQRWTAETDSEDDSWKII